MIQHVMRGLALFLALANAGLVCSAAEPLTLDSVQPPPEIVADEPLIARFSLAAAARYMDSAALSWQKEHSCTACHTMISYMMARRSLEPIEPSSGEVRAFFEEVAAGRRNPMPNYQCNDVESAVAIGVAASLAFDDQLGNGQLHALTRKALDRMWELQREDGSWIWPFRDTPPLKLREHYGTTLAAIAAGTAPDGYVDTEAARQGLARLNGYLRAHPPESLHEEAMLAWASSLVPDLSSADERQATLERLLAAQRPDGGWSLASLVENPRSPPAAASAEAAASLRADPQHGTQFLVYAGPDKAYKSSLASDGYATGLVICVARQAGIPADDERLQRGILWLKTNQRASGRWFSPSQAWHTQNLIANAGTAYAVLALHRCGEVPETAATARE